MSGRRHCNRRLAQSITLAIATTALLISCIGPAQAANHVIVSKSWNNVIEDYEGDFDESRHHLKENPGGRILQSEAIADFLPLPCNANGYSTCVPYSASALDLTSLVTIACGTCITLDITDGSTIDFSEGLNIEGKLEILSQANLVLKSPMIIVQGEWSIDYKSTPLTAPNPPVVIEMNGDTDRSFTPHSTNSAACGGSACNVGSKAIVVAGGKIDFDAMPQGCDSWVHISGTATLAGHTSIPTASPVALMSHTTTQFPVRPSPLTGCSDVLLSPEDNKWKPTVGVELATSNDGSWDGFSFYSQIKSRNADWMGLYRPVEDLIPCIRVGEGYILEAKIRLTTTFSQANSNCLSSGINCPKLRYSYMTNTNKVVWVTLVEFVPDYSQHSDNSWLTFRGSFEFTDDQINSNNIYAVMTLEGSEANIQMDVGEIQLSLPPASSYPDPNDPCGELLPNGNAETGFISPYESFVGTNKLTIRTDPQTGGNYFHLSKRSHRFSSPTISLLTGCTSEHAVYDFTATFRINSDAGDESMFIFKTYDPSDTALTGANASFQTLAICPKSSNSIGWITCTSQFTFGPEHEVSPRIEFLHLTIVDDSSDIDYDNLSLTFTGVGGNSQTSGSTIATAASTGVPIVGSTASCWGAGAEVLVTSSTLDAFDSSVTTLLATPAISNYYTAHLSSPNPSSDTSGPYAGEIALLSRNVEFRSDNSSNDVTLGAHFMIYRTSGVAQKIEGVSFVGFGQQGVKDRYPINFRQSKSSPSTVKHNTIRDSNQRCIVLSNTRGVVISNNVAHNTAGHCYAMQDGSESNNMFFKNLGSLTTKPTNLIAGASDGTPATFYITNSANSFQGNVAAGSRSSGYWFEMNTAVTGESLNDADATITSLNPSLNALSLFEGNIAHSNTQHGIKIYPTGFNSAQSNFLTNTKSYRNKLFGIYLYNGNNISVHGGVFADNLIGIDVNLSDNVVVKDLSIHGYSPEFRASAAKSGTTNVHCVHKSSGLTGLRLHPNLRSTSGSGTSVDSVTFDDFSNSMGCWYNNAIVMNKIPISATQTANSTFHNIKLGTNLEFDQIFSTCDLGNAGLVDVSIADSGSLNPLPTVSSPGVIVSDVSGMTTPYAQCNPMPGTSCAQYCSGSVTCMRKVTIHTNSQGPYPTAKLHVQEISKTGRVIVVEGVQILYSALIDTLWDKTRSYTVNLPGGDYTASFHDDQGNVVWNDFAVIQYETAPSCTGYFSSFSLVEPTPPQNYCDQLITDNFDSSLVDTQTGWAHSGGGVKLITPGNGNTGKALQTNGRTVVNNGPAKFFDSRCLQVGDQYEVTARMRLWFTSGGYSFCNPEDKYTGFVCPRASIKSSTKGDLSGSTSDTSQYEWSVANVPGPWSTSGAWNVFHGRFTITEEMVNADTVAFFIERLRAGVEIQLDDIVIQKYAPSCSGNIVSNPDFETGDFRDWWYLGSPKIEIVSPGSNGSPYALSTKTRQHYFWGMSQLLEKSCLVDKQMFRVTAKVKILDYKNGNAEYMCDPYRTFQSKSTCPNIAVQTRLANSPTLYQIAALPVGPWKDGWNDLFGYFTANSQMNNADDVELYISGAGLDLNIVVDDVTVTPIVNPFSCNELIKNGDFEIGDARFWTVNGGTIDIWNDGYNGSGFAAKHTNRGLLSHGMSQMIDNKCFKNVGETWRVDAQFKLVSGLADVPMNCDITTQFGTSACPRFILSVVEDPTDANSNVEITALENISTIDWIAAEYNTFSAVIDVTNAMMTWPKVVISTDRVNPGTALIMDDFSIRKIG